MAKLVFLQRTPSEAKLFGGQIFFDIDGKNIGKLSFSNQTVELPAGKHTIKMYKSHTYDTFIGFAQSTIDLTEEDYFMVRYSPPMMVNQPGNLMISEYSKQKAEEVLRNRERSIQQDVAQTEAEKRAANQKHSGVVVVMVLFFLITFLLIIPYIVSLQSFF